MMTVRQIERRWDGGEFRRLGRELLASRMEDSPRLRQLCTDAAAVAALAMIRLEELDQTHVPLYERLLRLVLKRQQADGGWGDPMLTALILRALLGCQGDGAAADGAIAYLAQLQKDEGAWPAEPLRRMPADIQTTAFILFQLAEFSRFRDAVNTPAALAYVETHGRQDLNVRLLTAGLATWSRAAAMN